MYRTFALVTIALAKFHLEIGKNILENIKMPLLEGIAVDEN